MENKLRQKNLNNILDLKNNFSKNGYLVIKKNFENNLTNKIIKEIDDADGTIKYLTKYLKTHRRHLLLLKKFRLVKLSEVLYPQN